MDLFLNVTSAVTILLLIVTLAVKVYALVDAARRPAQAFELVGKQSKNFWLIVLGISVLAGLVTNPIGLFGLIGIVAAMIYIFGVRPELQQYGGGGGRGQGGERMGPYGPW